MERIRGLQEFGRPAGAELSSTSMKFKCMLAFEKGQEMGYFHHGSTIIVLSTGVLKPCTKVIPGAAVRMGQALFEKLTTDTAA